VTISDSVLILATLAAPTVAIQIQKWLERQREERNGKLNIFRTLMATRATRIAPLHVEALNMIDVEFYGGKKANKRVRDAWKEYLGHLGVQSKDETETKLNNQKREDLFVQLLYEMAVALEFDFDKTHIRTHIYAPIGHGELELDQHNIRKGLVQILTGKQPLPMAITSVPPEDESQRIFREACAAQLQSGKPWPIEIVPPTAEPTCESRLCKGGQSVRWQRWYRLRMVVDTDST
jgi:hypothetical protein